MGWSKKEPRWQRTQKSLKRSKIKRFVVGCLVVIFLIFSAGFGYQFYKLFSESVWNGEGQLNLVLNTQPILIASFNPGEKSLNTLILPQEVLIKTVKGYGVYRLEAIFPLDKQEKQKGWLLKESLSEELGIPIDGYIAIQNSKEIKNSLREAIMSVLQNKEGETDLSRWDLLRLWWFARTVKESKIKVVDLGQDKAMEEVSQADGSQAVKINSSQAEMIIQSLFEDENFRQEGLSIAVVNATSHFGLAAGVARLINNIGGRVVEVGDRESLNGECEIRSTAKAKNSYTVRRLKKIFACAWGGENLEDQRAEVAVILGEKYWEKLNQK